MKRKPGTPNPKLETTPGSIRTSMSFSRVVWDIMQRQMTRRGFNNNLSAYLSDLARRDEERTLELNALQKYTGKDGKVGGGGVEKDKEINDTAIETAAREILRRALRQINARSPRAATGLEHATRAPEWLAPLPPAHPPAATDRARKVLQSPANPPSKAVSVSPPLNTAPVRQ